VEFFKKGRNFLTALVLILVLTTTSACAGATQAKEVRNLPTNAPAVSNPFSFKDIEHGNTLSGQEFGSWVVTKANGLVKDAYVRDNNKLGVVISKQVRPKEVKDLAKSLLQGFHQNFPNQDLTVLMYAPDKQLILTAKYDEQSKQLQYQ